MSEFDKIIGYETVKKELMRFCDVLKNPEKYRRLGATMPSGILLHGEPGLGKTLMAKCFIQESGCRAFTIRKEKPNGDFVNEIKNTFEKASQNGPAIVFLDDIDKFANEDYSHCDAEEYVTVQSCIDECKGKDVFALATANDIGYMPDSLLRAGRFDKTIELECPEEQDSRRIIEHFLDQKKVVGDVDTEEIARFMENQSCADLETVVNEAGIYAGYEGKEKIEQCDIVRACLRMIYNTAESMDSSDSEWIRRVAVHEAGHATISEVLEPGSVNFVSLYGHAHSKKGLTRVKRPAGYHYSMTIQEHEVIRRLGGKAAIEVVYADTDMGSNSDLDRVYDLVSRFVDDKCAYGFDAYEGHNPSEYLLENKHRMIACEVGRFYRQAKKIIVSNRGFLDTVVEALIEKKILTYRDIQKIKRQIVLSA